MAGKFNLTIDIGSQFDWLIGYDDMEGNMVEWETEDLIRMQVRPTIGATPVLDLDTDAKGGIEKGLWTSGEHSFNIRVNVPATDTENLPQGKHRYDIEVVPGGVEANAKRIIQGIAYISPQVTDG